MGIFRTKMINHRYFLEHECIFLLVNIKFYDTVNMIHDVIRTTYLFPHTAKFVFVGVRYNKTKQIRC